MAIATNDRIGDLEQTVRTAANRKLYEALYAHLGGVAALLKSSGAWSYGAVGLYYKTAAGAYNPISVDDLASKAAAAISEATKDATGRVAVEQFVCRVGKLVE